MGLGVTVDYLGDPRGEEDRVRQTMRAYDELLAAMDRYGVDGGISLKLSAFGQEAAVREVVASAFRWDRRVWIDMEDSAWHDRVFRLYEKLRDPCSETVGIALQASLYGACDDLVKVGQSGRALVRVVKGAYPESPAIACQRLPAIRERYMDLVQMAYDAGHYVAVATHDQVLLRQVLELKLDTDQIEFQMLYGLHEPVLAALVGRGFRAVVYVPYGTDWYGYYLRRVVERPSLLMYRM
jgi:proline dehydrogenase